MKILKVEAELFLADGRTDRLTDMSKIIVACRNFAKAPRKTPKIIYRHANIPDRKLYDEM